MRVAYYYSNSDVRIEEKPIPKIGKGELLVKIKASGICGSDVMEWYRVGNKPRILGHEIAGEVVEVGEGIENIKVGQRIAASHHVPCYSCHYCLMGEHTLCDTLRTTNFDPGGFSEWVRLPAINTRYGVYPLPDHISFEEATLIEPLACVVRGQNKINTRAGQTVLVIGCGVSGLLHILLAKLRGVAKVIACDVVDFRLETALQLGADCAFLSSESLAKKIAENNQGRLADVVIVCAGSKNATLQALSCTERGGDVLFFALQSPDQVVSLPMNEVFWKKGLTLTSTYAASPENHRESLNLIQENKIKAQALITHRLGLSEIARGFELVSKATESIKVVIDPVR